MVCCVVVCVGVMPCLCCVVLWFGMVGLRWLCCGLLLVWYGLGWTGMVWCVCVVVCVLCCDVLCRDVR